jgi:hypothetical protein
MASEVTAGWSLDMSRCDRRRLWSRSSITGHVLKTCLGLSVWSYVGMVFGLAMQALCVHKRTHGYHPHDSTMIPPSDKHSFPSSFAQRPDAHAELVIVVVIMLASSAGWLAKRRGHRSGRRREQGLVMSERL